MADADAQAARGLVRAFAAGGLVGTLGGLIGLGGAEFRLPLLVGPFRFPPLEAIILNKAMSLIVVATALIFRRGTISFTEIAAHWPIVVNFLAGSIAGAWFGAGLATRIRGALHRIIGLLLVLIALILAFGHDLTGGHPIFADAIPRIVAGVILIMALGSIVGGMIGGLLLGIVPERVLLPILAAILIISAMKMLTTKQH